MIKENKSVEVMEEAISWGEVNGKKPSSASKDLKEKRLGLFLVKATQAKNGKGTYKFKSEWINMIENHPMPHIRSYLSGRIKICSSRRAEATKRMKETIAWSEVSREKPSSNSKDPEQKRLGKFLDNARQAQRGAKGSCTFYSFWIKMIKDHPMMHIRDFLFSNKELLELKEISELKVVSEIKEISELKVEKKKKPSRKSKAKEIVEGNIRKMNQPVFEEMAEIFIEEEVDEAENAVEGASLSVSEENESPSEAAEREYLNLVSNSSSDVMLRLAKKIIEEQNEKELYENRYVFKEICDMTMRKLINRAHYLYV